MTSFLEHLSHNICRVIFWNFEMASASICRINICRITFIVKNMILVKRYNTSSNRFTFLGISVTSFLEHLSRNICRVIFWNFEMASASICRINICRITFIVKNMILVKRYNTSSNRFTFLGISVTSFLEHLSHNICRVIFWNFEMAPASICRINICRTTFIVKNMILVKRYNTSSNRISYTVRIN